MSWMKRGLLILKLLGKMRTRILTLSSRSDFNRLGDDDCDDDDVRSLPEDVKEGHFVVQTVNDGELKRFIIELSYLEHPGFLNLLEQAVEEFGFEQEGVLAVACGPSELRRILENGEERRE
ncbi:unnamed protein product [Ilex paraguariensis]|uniref:Uncharacterized protein n=1 Tax=Ilex paraguariensis TaxID=185542 RepID=A0ABC8SUA2_9AQUA